MLHLWATFRGRRGLDLRCESTIRCVLVQLALPSRLVDMDRRVFGWTGHLLPGETIFFCSYLEVGVVSWLAVCSLRAVCCCW